MTARRRAPAASVVRAEIRAFRAMLDRHAPEEELHAFLAPRRHFWNGLVRLTGGSPLYSKVRLGAEYVADFLYCDTSSNGAEWSLVELEPASFRLFTERGNPTAHLTHAIGQVRKWQRWVDEDRFAAQQLMPRIYRPMGHVFLGRRSELRTPALRRVLHALNVDNRHYVRVHTLDWFLEAAESSLGWRHMSYADRMYSDGDLRSGMPEEMVRWVNSHMGRQRLYVSARASRPIYDERPSHKRPRSTPISVQIERTSDPIPLDQDVAPIEDEIAPRRQALTEPRSKEQLAGATRTPRLKPSV